MNLKHLAQAIQNQHYFEAHADAVSEAKTASASATATARAANPFAKEVKVKARDITNEVPTRAWCERIAKKHVKAARNKAGRKKSDFLLELLDLVKKDPDKKGKKPNA